MQARPFPRFDRFHLAVLATVALLSGSVGAGIGVWIEDSGGATGITTLRQDLSSTARSERSLGAEAARHEAQASAYGHVRGDVARGRRADAARWEAAADFYRSLDKR
jgi:hypothetical protein